LPTGEFSWEKGEWNSSSKRQQATHEGERESAGRTSVTQKAEFRRKPPIKKEGGEGAGLNFWRKEGRILEGSGSKTKTTNEEKG